MIRFSRNLLVHSTYILADTFNTKTKVMKIKRNIETINYLELTFKMDQQGRIIYALRMQYVIVVDPKTAAIISTRRSRLSCCF